MFSKRILSAVAILFAYGLNAVKADSNDPGFHIMKKDGTEVTNFEMSNLNSIKNELYIKKCDNGNYCNRVFGYIKGSDVDQYIGIYKAVGNDIINDGVEFDPSYNPACNDDENKWEKGFVFSNKRFCINGKVVQIPGSGSKSYLLKDNIENIESAFYDLKQEGELGIVIVAQAAVSGKTPDMIVFDTTHNGDNDCFVESDSTISGRIDNLCGQDGNACTSYLNCGKGVCENSESVFKRNIDDLGRDYSFPTPPTCNVGTGEYCVEGIEEDDDGNFYNCDGEGHQCPIISAPGYYYNKKANDINYKYLKCDGINACAYVQVGDYVNVCEAAGELRKIDGDVSSYEIKLCLGGGKELSIFDTTQGAKFDNTEYFISVNEGNIFGGEMTNHFTSVTVNKGSVTKTEVDQTINGWYKYANADNKILTRDDAKEIDTLTEKSLCGTPESILEYQIRSSETGNNFTGGFYEHKGNTN